jgi:hypothetical protein
MNLDSEISRLDEELKLLKKINWMSDAVIVWLVLAGACILRYEAVNAKEQRRMREEAAEALRIERAKTAEENLDEMRLLERRRLARLKEQEEEEERKRRLQRLKDERLRAMLEKNEERLKEMRAERIERSIIAAAEKQVAQARRAWKPADEEKGFFKALLNALHSSAHSEDDKESCLED